MSGKVTSAGRTLAAVADREPLPPLPTADTLPAATLESHPAFVLPQQLQLARERGGWLAQQLAGQVAAEGLAGLVSTTHVRTPDGEVVEASEQIRALAVAEAAERDRAARLAVEIAKLGLDAGALRQDRARLVVEALRHLVRELGFDDQDEAVVRLAKRAALAASGAADVRDAPFGPAPSRAEQVAALRAAADRLDAEMEGEAEAARAADAGVARWRHETNR